MYRLISSILFFSTSFLVCSILFFSIAFYRWFLTGGFYRRFLTGGFSILWTSSSLSVFPVLHAGVNDRYRCGVECLHGGVFCLRLYAFERVLDQALQVLVTVAAVLGCFPGVVE